MALTQLMENHSSSSCPRRDDRLTLKAWFFSGLLSLHEWSEDGVFKLHISPSSCWWDPRMLIVVAWDSWPHCTHGSLSYALTLVCGPSQNEALGDVQAISPLKFLSQTSDPWSVRNMNHRPTCKFNYSKKLT